MLAASRPVDAWAHQETTSLAPGTSTGTFIGTFTGTFIGTFIGMVNERPGLPARRTTPDRPARTGAAAQI